MNIKSRAKFKRILFKLIANIKKKGLNKSR
jgi:hypothetical protein